MRPIEEVHIAQPNGKIALCGLSADSVWRLTRGVLITLAEAAVDLDLFPEEEKCDICWRDEEARTLMLLGMI
jgi:hypothetical protein